MIIKGTIPSNWYESRIESELRLLSIFIKSVEAQIVSNIQDYSENQEPIIAEHDEWDIHVPSVNWAYQGIDDSEFHLDDIFKNYLPNLHRVSAFITLNNFFEGEIKYLCDLFKRINKYKVSISDLRKEGSDIYKGIKYLSLICNLDIDKKDFEYKKLDLLISVRNKFVHELGVASGDFRANIEKTMKESNFNIVKFQHDPSEENNMILTDESLSLILEFYRSIFLVIQSKII